MPPQYIKDAYEYAKKPKVVNGSAADDGKRSLRVRPQRGGVLDPFIDIIGRNFKQPKEGLGFDNSPTAHMWRTMMYPDNPQRAHGNLSINGSTGEGLAGWACPD